MNQYYKRKEVNNLGNREKWRVINTDDDYILCSKCLRTNKATKNDISHKNPNYYFKNCKDCRDYFKNYRNANGIDYKKYQRDYITETTKST